MDLLWRRRALPSPGTYESLHRETKLVFPTLHAIDGARFDVQASHNQSFHTSHSFAWGSAQSKPSYHFMSVYDTPKFTLNGQVDNDGSVAARANYNWIAIPAPPMPDPENPSPPMLPDPPKVTSTTKLQASISAANPTHDMFQVEHDHIDTDWSLNVKAVNANPFDRAPSWSPNKSSVTTTGMFSISYLQSITNSLALGAELAYQRPTPDLEAPALSYALRYAPPASELPRPLILPPDCPSPYQPVNPKDPTQAFTATWTPAAGVLHSTYWRRINQRLEVGSELQLLMTGGPSGKREGLASVGFKLDTLFSTIRAMIDTHGRVSAVIEEKISPGISLLLSGEIDYGQASAGRVGVGFQLQA